MACSNCGGEKVVAKGLCQGCYHRLRRTGAVTRTNVRNTGRCSSPGCEKAAFAKNLCAAHYQRADHPLKVVWKLLRSRNPGVYPPSWEVFTAFLADVGERPSLKHQLRRIDGDKPYAADNVRWVGGFGPKNSTMTNKERSTYNREDNLRRKFGIDGAGYDAILVAQQHKCAVCRKPEWRRGKHGEPKSLAVDHDHGDGTVRGLLCTACNQGLGHFLDDPDLLRAAAAYIERHRRPRLACDAVA
jgi:hypothetical protein